MLTSLLVYLKPKRSHSLKPSVGRSVHGLFLRILSEVEPILSRDLHSQKGLKPFTLSCPFGSFKFILGKKVVQGDKTYWVRFTFLTEELFRAFSKGLSFLREKSPEVFLDGEPFEIVDVHFQKVCDSLPDFFGYFDLVNFVEKNSFEHPLVFLTAFLSPTTFRRGKANRVFPDPPLVFASYLKKWNRFSNHPFPEKELLEVIENEETFVVSEYRLRSDCYCLGNSYRIGFRGECRFRILRENESELLCYLRILHLFSFYSGTGQGTTMGMGVTQPIVSIGEENLT